AVEAAVRLSARYISGRQLPDKSVSLLDTAAARVALSQTATPPAVEDARRRITLLETEQRVLKGEEAVGGSHADRIVDVESSLAEAKTNLAQLEERWEKEKTLVDRIRTIRRQLRQHALA